MTIDAYTLGRAQAQLALGQEKRAFAGLAANIGRAGVAGTGRVMGANVRNVANAAGHTAPAARNVANAVPAAKPLANVAGPRTGAPTTPRGVTAGGSVMQSAKNLWNHPTVQKGFQTATNIASHPLTNVGMTAAMVAPMFMNND